MSPRPALLALLCAVVPVFAQAAPPVPDEYEALPESAQRRFCGLLFDGVLDAMADELKGTEPDAADEAALRKRAFVLAELRLANESLIYGGGSERDLRVSQSLLERLEPWPAAEVRPYLARCVAAAAPRAEALRRDVGPTARDRVVEQFLAQRLPPPPTAATAGPVALPPRPATGGDDAWFPTEGTTPPSAPAAPR